MFDFRNFINFVIDKYDFTQSQFAIISGTDKLTVWRWCNKISLPSHDHICHIIVSFLDDFIYWLNLRVR